MSTDCIFWRKLNYINVKERRCKNVLFAPYINYMFSYLVTFCTEWPPIGKIAAHSAYETLS